jgi:peptide deformylase
MMIKIVQKGNKLLRGAAKSVSIKEIKSKEIKNIVKKMEKALLENKEGVAIAAPQIGEPLRIFVIAKKIFGENILLPKLVFINPVIKNISKKKSLMNEGCLSVSGYYGNVQRAERLKIEALDENGKKFGLVVSGLLAQIVQHEVDHLNGILFTDKAINLEKIINV